VSTHTPNPMSLAPEFFPIILVLLPILTWAAAVEMAPLTITTFFASLATAAVNWAYVETVVVVPPPPPVVPPFCEA